MHKKVISFIKVLRESFHDSYIVYSFGGCYGLYKILKHTFPSAQAYHYDKDLDHIVTKIGGRFYAIKGEMFDMEDPIKLTKAQMEHWDAVSYGQRLEFMLEKYNEKIKEKN